MHLSNRIGDGVRGRETGNSIGYWIGNLRFGRNWNGWRKLKRCHCIFEPIAKGNRIAGEVAAPKAIQKLGHQLQSRHDRECQIVPIATFVAGLEIVAVDRDDAAIGKVAEGAGDRRECGVIDNSQNQTLGQGALSCPIKLKLALLSIVTPLATTVSAFARLLLALKV